MSLEVISSLTSWEQGDHGWTTWETLNAHLWLTEDVLLCLSLIHI